MYQCNDALRHKTSHDLRVFHISYSVVYIMALRVILFLLAVFTVKRKRLYKLRAHDNYNQQKNEFNMKNAKYY